MANPALLIENPGGERKGEYASSKVAYNTVKSYSKYTVMSSLKQLEKAAKVVAEIKKLDERIIELEKLAELVANGGTEHSFELKIKQPKPEAIKTSFDEDGSLVIDPVQDMIKMMSAFSYHSIKLGCSEKEDKNTTTFKDTPSDVTTLHILGFLLSGLVTKREALINKIQKLGFKI